MVYETYDKYLMKGNGFSISRICPSCIAASIRTLAGTLIGGLSASYFAVSVTLDCHKASVLHRLVILSRDGKVFSLDDGLVVAFCFLRGHQGLSLAVGDLSPPCLGHVVGGRVWESRRKGKT